MIIFSLIFFLSSVHDSNSSSSHSTARNDRLPVLLNQTLSIHRATLSCQDYMTIPTIPPLHTHTHTLHAACSDLQQRQFVGAIHYHRMNHRMDHHDSSLPSLPLLIRDDIVRTSKHLRQPLDHVTETTTHASTTHQLQKKRKKKDI